jgi:ankyrin repeat protein
MSTAMTRASLDTIRMLFNHGGDINRGQLLHNAVLRTGPESEAVELVELLLSKGAPINAIKYISHEPSYRALSPFSLGTPLHYAVRKGNLKVVSCLLENGADPCLRDTKGRTAVDDARSSGEMGEALVEQILRHMPQ